MFDRTLSQKRWIFPGSYIWKVTGFVNITVNFITTNRGKWYIKEKEVIYILFNESSAIL